MKTLCLSLGFCFCWCASGLFAQEADPCNNAVTPRNGEYTKYYQNGKIESKTYFVNGRADGTWFFYYEDGTLKEVRSYWNNLQTGQAVCYYPNGKAERQKTYVNGYPRGLELTWYQSGKLHTRQYLITNPNDPRSNYDVVPRDTVFRWYENGQLQYLAIYNNGIQQEHTEWYVNGSLREKIIYADGHAYADGIYEVFAANGRLLLRKTMQGHMQWGITETYDTLTGKRIKQTEYLNGEKQGEEHVFAANGTLEKTNYYYKDQLLLTVNSMGADGQSSWFRHVPLITTSDDTHDFADTKHMGFVRGTIHDGVYYIETIRDQYGHTMIRRGKGYYEGPAAFAGNALNDLQIMKSERRYSGYAEKAWEHATDFKRLALSFDDYVECSSEFSHGRWAAGHFENGLKEGVWREGRLKVFEYYKKKWIDVPDYAASASYAIGQYHQGKKTGIWKIHIGHWTFEGAFENNKPVGEWHSSKRTDESLNDKYQQIPSHDMDEYYPDAVPVSGSYSNGLPDGLWTVFAEDGKTPACKVRFVNGEFRGMEQQYYPNGKLAATYVWDGALVQREQNFTPEGDLLSETQLEANKKAMKFIPIGLTNYYAPEQMFVQMQNDLPHGRLYAWDRQTGHVLLEGFFEQGKPVGTWRERGEDGKDEVQRIGFVNGKFHGECKEIFQHNADSGYYDNGKRTGLWKRVTFEGIREELLYRNDSVLYWGRKNRNKIEVVNGGGEFIKPKDFFDKITKTVYVKNGVQYREKQTFSDGSIARDIYHTLLGDSVAAISLEPGSQCIQNGYGSVSEYDNYGQKIKTTFYEDGYIQKEVFYSQGKQTKEIIFFPSRLNVLQPDTLPYITRTIVQQERRYVFYVTDVIHHIPPGAAGELYVKQEYITLIGVPGENTTIFKEGSYYRIGNGKRNADGSISFTYCLEKNLVARDNDYFEKQLSFYTEYRLQGQKTATATFDRKLLRIYLR